MTDPVFVAGLRRARRNWGWFLVLGLILIVLGAAALWETFLPLVTIISVLFFGWVLVIAGGVQILSSPFARESSGGAAIFLQLMAGILSLVVGALMIAQPEAGAIALTLLFAAFFLFSGAFRFMAALGLRYPNWGWGMLGGLITVALGVMLCVHWPESGLWFIGVAIAVDLIVHGFVWVMFALALRHVETVDFSGVSSAVRAD